MAKKLIDKKTIEHITRLANLPLTVREVPKYQVQLSQIIEFVGKIDEVQKSNFKKEDQKNAEEVLRKDEPNAESLLSQEDALKNGKETQKGLFMVPLVLNNTV